MGKSDRRQRRVLRLEGVGPSLVGGPLRDWGIEGRRDKGGSSLRLNEHLASFGAGMLA